MLELKENLADKNIFLEKIPGYQSFLIYAPLSGAAAVLDNKTVEQFATGKQAQELQELSESLLEDAVSPEVPLRCETAADLGVLYVIPNFKCNFRCTYCYAASTRNTNEISLNTLISGIKAFLSTSKCHRVRICFMGGGEPLLSWEVIHDALAILAEYPDRIIEVSVITNGSIVSEVFLSDCKLYNIKCNVSFDILPDLQEQQRGNYQLVKNNILKLLSENIPVRLRATITPDAVLRLPEMVREILKAFGNKVSLILEPVTSAALIPDKVAAQNFFQTYYSQFVESLTIASANNLVLQNSFLRASEDVQGRFCRNMITLLPEGQSIKCPCFASPDPSFDFHSDTNYIGMISGKELCVAETGKNNFSPVVDSLEQCRLCIAKWHCAGGCEHHRREYSKEVFDEICILMQRFTIMSVLQKLDTLYKASGLPGVYDVLQGEQ